MEKIKIESLGLRELLEYDAAAKQIVTELSNISRKYDGSFDGSYDDKARIQKYSDIHNRLSFELMRRLDNLE